MVTVLRTELYKGGHTGHRQWSRDHSLFRIRFVVIVAPFCKGRDSIGAHIPVLVTGNIFLQFFPILQPAWLHWYPPCVQGHGPQAVSCEVHISLFGELDLAPWKASQAAASPAPKFHPQIALFFAPKVSVAHQGKQQHVV